MKYYYFHFMLQAVLLHELRQCLNILNGAYMMTFLVRDVSRVSFEDEQTEELPESSGQDVGMKPHEGTEGTGTRCVKEGPTPRPLSKTPINLLLAPTYTGFRGQGSRCENLNPPTNGKSPHNLPFTADILNSLCCT